VLRDNVWGPQEEDARGATSPSTPCTTTRSGAVVVDYHGGIKDAKKKRAAHDRRPGHALPRRPGAHHPRRALRGQAGALGFKIEPKTKAPLRSSLPLLLADVPQSRLFDEMLKLLQTGHSLATIEQLKVLGLARGIYPLLDLVVERADQPFVRAALQDTDRRVGEGKPVAPSFLLACVLWPTCATAGPAAAGRGSIPFPALQDAIDDVFESRIGDISGRGKLGADMREIWMMQPRFEKRTGSTPFSLVEQPRFRAGFDFMRLRADIGEVDVVLADWWQEFSTAYDAAPGNDYSSTPCVELETGLTAPDLLDHPAADRAAGRPRSRPYRNAPRTASARPGFAALRQRAAWNQHASRCRTRA
jgi:poly(A) polymerase